MFGNSPLKYLPNPEGSLECGSVYLQQGELCLPSEAFNLLQQHLNTPLALRLFCFPVAGGLGLHHKAQE